MWNTYSPIFMPNAPGITSPYMNTASALTSYMRGETAQSKASATSKSPPYPQGSPTKHQTTVKTSGSKPSETASTKPFGFSSGKPGEGSSKRPLSDSSADSPMPPKKVVVKRTTISTSGKDGKQYQKVTTSSGQTYYQPIHKTDTKSPSGSGNMGASGKQIHKVTVFPSSVAKSKPKQISHGTTIDLTKPRPSTAHAASSSLSSSQGGFKGIDLTKRKPPVEDDDDIIVLSDSD